MTTAKRAPTGRAHSRPEGWWAYPPVYAVVVYLVGFVPGLPWWAFVVMGVSAGLFGALIARHVFDPITYGSTFATSAGWCAGLAGVGAAAWLAYAVPHPAQVWQWLVLWLAVFGGWFTLLVWAAPRAADSLDRQMMLGPVKAADPTDPLEPYPTILARAQVTNVRVLDVTRSPSGGVETVRVTPSPAPGKRATTYSTFAQSAEAIATEAAREFLVSRDIDLQVEDVLPEPGRNAAEFLLHFTVRRTLQGDVPFVMDLEPQPWATKWIIGKYEDDRPIELQLCHPDRGAAHMDIVGMTGSGKGVLLAVLIARLTASDEGEVWLIGTKKLVKLAWGWILPWLRGETDRPVIDRIGGEDEREALMALADALHYAELCNGLVPTSGARKATRGKGGLVLVLDEVSKLLDSKTKWPTHDGRRLTASQMVAEIQALGRTGPVSVVKANQDQLFGSFGDAGPQQQRNSGIGVALQVRRGDDATKLLQGLPGTVNATKLRDNQMYVRPNTDDDRVMKGKAQSLLDDEIPRVAAHNTRFRYGLDPDITRHLRTYADRWAPARHAALIRAAESQGLEWPMATDDDRPPASREPAPAGDARPAPAGAGDDHPELPPAGDALPAGWDGDGFDIWAALAAGDAPAEQGSDQDVPAAPAAGGALPAADTSGIESAGRRLVEALRAHLPGDGRPGVPEPLSLVLAVLAKPGAPTDWVPTQTLAVAIGRVAPGASPEEKRRAAEQLGRDLGGLDAALQATPPKRKDGERLRGFLVADLRAAGERLSGR